MIHGERDLHYPVWRYVGMRENPVLSLRIPPKSGWLDSLQKDPQETQKKDPSGCNYRFYHPRYPQYRGIIQEITNFINVTVKADYPPPGITARNLSSRKVNIGMYSGRDSIQKRTESASLRTSTVSHNRSTM